MSISIDELIETIQNSIVQKDVLEKYDGYYADSNNATSETTITYIDPYKLIENLRNHGQQTLG